MCGIVARVDGGDAAEAVALLLEERGPHGTATWRDGALALGLARLAIVAPQEPARVHASSAYAAVMNGELYEHRRLRAELGLAVDDATSDQALLPALFARGAVDAIRRTRAPVTCAVADARAQTISLLRDRFGKRPLYVDVTAGRAASEMKALIAMRRSPPRFDRDAIARFLQRGILEDRAPLVHDIASVAPGAAWVMHARDGASAPSSPPPPHSSSSSSAQEDGELVDVLRAACRRRVEGLEVRSAVLLSGGLDSSVVAALVREHIGVAYTMRIRSSDTSDESERAQAMADALGLELRVVDVAVPTLADLAACAWRLETPDAFVGFGVAHAYATLARRLREDGVRVVVTGEGADELFMGYAWQRAQAAAQNGWPFPADVAGVGELAWARASLASARDARALEVYLRARFGEPWRAVRPEGAPWDVGAFVDDKRVAETDDQARAPAPSSPPPLRGAERRRAESLGVDLPMWPLRIADRILMGHGIETRAPFLDEDVVDAALAIPAHDHERVDEDKPLLRAVARAVLPRDTRVARKQGFAAWSWPGAATTRAWAARLADEGTLLARADALHTLARAEGANGGDADARALLAWRLVMLEVTARQLDAARTGAPWRP